MWVVSFHSHDSSLICAVCCTCWLLAEKNLQILLQCPLQRVSAYIGSYVQYSLTTFNATAELLDDLLSTNEENNPDYKYLQEAVEQLKR